MPRQRGLHRVLGRFEVADLAHQHHVGVVPKDRPEARGKGQPDLRVDLDLVDPLELVLDRILGRDDLGLFVADLVQRAIQGGRLARTRRPGDQNDAVRELDQAGEASIDGLVHADAAQRELHAVLVEHPHHHALAVEHGNDRHADVHLAPMHLELDPAVLRHALLGDVQLRHDLQAAEDRGLEAIDLGRHGLFLEDAVDAVADLHAAGLGLQVDVARPGLDRLDQDLVDQPHHRGLLGLFGRLRVVELDLLEHLDLGVLLLRQEAVDRLGPDPEMGLDQPGQLVGQGKHRGNAHPHRGTDRVEGMEIQGIADRHDQRALLTAERKHAIAVNQLRGEIVQDGRIDLGGAQIDRFEPHRLPHGAQRILLGLGGETEFGRELAKTDLPSRDAPAGGKARILKRLHGEGVGYGHRVLNLRLWNVTVRARLPPSGGRPSFLASLAFSIRSCQSARNTGGQAETSKP
jgi:hypothetical protein